MSDWWITESPLWDFDLSFWCFTSFTCLGHNQFSSDGLSPKWIARSISQDYALSSEINGRSLSSVSDSSSDSLWPAMNLVLSNTLVSFQSSSESMASWSSSLVIESQSPLNFGCFKGTKCSDSDSEELQDAGLFAPEWPWFHRPAVFCAVVCFLGHLCGIFDYSMSATPVEVFFLVPHCAIDSIASILCICTCWKLSIPLFSGFFVIFFGSGQIFWGQCSKTDSIKILLMQIILLGVQYIICTLFRLST